MNFKPSWRMRGLWAAPAFRKSEPLPHPVPRGSNALMQSNELVLDEKLAPMPPESPEIGAHCVWLNTLKASARNSTDMLSRISKCLNKAKSKLVLLGLRRKLRPLLPNVNPCGKANADGLNKYGPELPTAVGGLESGLPTTSGYDPAETIPLATPALSPNCAPLVTLNGVPVCQRVIPEICQPPSSTCSIPPVLKKGRS